MDYEKKYKEALERAKEQAIDGYLDAVAVNDIFPELADSEDEKIIQFLIHEVKETSDKIMSYRCMNKEAVLAWLEKQGQTFTKKDVDDAWLKGMCDAKHELEKQGEQKPAVDTKVIIPKFRVGDIVKSKSQPMLSPRKIISIGKDCYWCEDRGCIGFAWEDDCEIVEQNTTDKIEPKFKVGDWVVSPNGVYWHIDAIRDGRYQVSSDSGEGAEWPLDTNIYHRFTIQDAKDGDVIYSRHNTESFEWIGIFKSLDKENKRVFFYGFWHNISKSFSVCRNEAYVLYNDFSPATKEQREQLEKAMAVAGFTFDFDKKN